MMVTVRTCPLALVGPMISMAFVAAGGAFGATVFGRVLSIGLFTGSGVGYHLTTTVGWAFVVVAVVAVLVFALLLLLPTTPAIGTADQRPDSTGPNYSGTESRPSHVATDIP